MAITTTMHRRSSSSSCLVGILLLRCLLVFVSAFTADQFARVNFIGAAGDGALRDLVYPEEVFESETSSSSRRKILQKMIVATSGLAAQPSQAVVTDETDTFATPALEGTYYTQRTPSSAAITTTPAQTSIMAPPPNLSDEITFTITKGELQNMQGGFGLELGEVSFKTNFRVVIKSVAPNSLAQKLGIQPNWVVVSIDGANGERTNAAGAAIYFSQAVKKVLNSDDSGTTLSLIFRDPAKFRDELESFPSKSLGSSRIGSLFRSMGRTVKGRTQPGRQFTFLKLSRKFSIQTTAVQPCRSFSGTRPSSEMSSNHSHRKAHQTANFQQSVRKLHPQEIPRSDSKTVL